MPSVIDVIGMVIGLVIVQSWKEIVTRQGVILVLALVQEGTDTVIVEVGVHLEVDTADVGELLVKCVHQVITALEDQRRELLLQQVLILALGHELQKRKKIANQVAVALVNLPVAALLQERIVVEV